MINLVNMEKQAGATEGQPFVVRIEIKTEVDECPNFDYLNELASDDNIALGVTCEPYAEEDREMAKVRLATYGRLWNYRGVYAEAEVAYRAPGQNGFCLEWFKSGGLWGVSSDETDEYLETIAKEELGALHLHLQHFGIMGFAEAEERRKEQ